MFKDNKISYNKNSNDCDNIKYRIFSVIILCFIGILGWFYIAQPELESRKLLNTDKSYNTIPLGLDKIYNTIPLGLDLVGGSQLVYNADVSKINEIEIDGAMESLRQTLTKRLNAFGTSEISIIIEEASIFSENNEKFRRLSIQIPGVSDVEEAKKLIGKIPLLEFKVKLPIKNSQKEIVEGNEIFYEYKDIGLTGKHLKAADLTRNEVGRPAVLITFNNEGTKLFADLTREHIGKQMGIFIDGIPISEPVLRATITNGVSVIEGGFTLEEASSLTKNLKFGALPVSIALVSSNTVSPSLGETVLNLGIKAAFIGLLLVAIFLIFFYKVTGIVAVVALTSYIVLTLSIFKLFGFVFTSAGIAGFVISIGMAVDANILIFERIKEELKNGKKMKESVELGFERAWLSIRDGNMSSILTAIILFYMTSSLVQGFSLTFGFGVLISTFTAIVLTRTFLLAIIGKSNKEKIKNRYLGDWDFFNHQKNNKK